MQSRGASPCPIGHASDNIPFLVVRVPNTVIGPFRATQSHDLAYGIQIDCEQFANSVTDGGDCQFLMGRLMKLITQMSSRNIPHQTVTHAVSKTIPANSPACCEQASER